MRVEAGASFLDEHYGKQWAGFIAHDMIDLTSCTTCILGQLHGSFMQGRSRYQLTRDQSVKLGFVPLHYFDEETAAAEINGLRAEWQRQILLRRAG